MTDPILIVVQWDGEDQVFRPTTPYQAQKAAKHYENGHRYTIAEYHQTSDASRGFFFANLKEIWETLPDHLAREFPNPEILRKHGLVHCGYADKESLVASSKAEAKRLAAFIARGDQYAVVTVEESVVTKFTARSMKGRSMDQKTFTAAAGKVLDWAAALVGSTKEQVEPSA